MHSDEKRFPGRPRPAMRAGVEALKDSTSVYLGHAYSATIRQARGGTYRCRVPHICRTSMFLGRFGR
jgi:hypothetical protein